ncbi:MAG: HD domain-containing protein [Polyangia bacterium]
MTSRFPEALVLANELHQTQTRKGKKTPYIAHLLGVASITLEHGGNEDQAIAALLHDAVEDQGGLPTLERIRTAFGDVVAELVVGLTDAVVEPKPPWRARKEQYLEHLAKSTDAVRLVSMADKLYNVQTIVRDLRAEGLDTFKRFNGGLEGTLWYYRALVETYRNTSSHRMPLFGELDRAVQELEARAK